MGSFPFPYPFLLASLIFSVEMLLQSPQREHWQPLVTFPKPLALGDPLMSHLLWEGTPNCPGPGPLLLSSPTVKCGGQPCEWLHYCRSSHLSWELCQLLTLPWARRKYRKRLTGGRPASRAAFHTGGWERGHVRLGAPSRNNTDEIKGGKWLPALLPARHLGNINFTGN